jgi:hypothetical protein
MVGRLVLHLPKIILPALIPIIVRYLLVPLIKAFLELLRLDYSLLNVLEGVPHNLKDTRHAIIGILDVVLGQFLFLVGDESHHEVRADGSGLAPPVFEGFVDVLGEFLAVELSEAG